MTTVCYAEMETDVIATAGTAGATTVRTATDVSATAIPAAGVTGFSEDQTIAVDSGADSPSAARR